MTWHRQNPDLLATEQRCLEEAYPDLLLDRSREQVVVKGVMQVAGEVGYSVSLLIPDRYPHDIPEQRCDPREIPWDIDRHVYPRTGFACLCVRSEYRGHWPYGSNLTDFLENLVRPFFIGQLYYQAHGRWPGGAARSHGREGVVEAYRDILSSLGPVTPETIQQVMRLLVRKNDPKGHETCPCGSGKRLRHCHRDLLATLRRQIDPRHATLDYRTLVEYEYGKPGAGPTSGRTPTSSQPEASLSRGRTLRNHRLTSGTSGARGAPIISGVRQGGVRLEPEALPIRAVPQSALNSGQPWSCQHANPS